MALHPLAFFEPSDPMWDAARRMLMLATNEEMT
jgi:hypothetical protein